MICVLLYKIRYNIVFMIFFVKYYLLFFYDVYVYDIKKNIR